MSQENTVESIPNRLTAYPAGSLRELLSLSLPIMLVLFSSSLMGFIERILLTRFSIEAVEAGVNALYLSRIFQTPCVTIALMAQVFVGIYYGSKRLTNIGPCVWQIIWFSLISMLFVVPIGACVANFYFKGTMVNESVFDYFYLLMCINFLFPLGSALSCFYFGRGKTNFIVFITFLAQLLNILLDVLLIFGWKGYIPELGILGAAVATLVSQSFFCIVLFALFIKKSNRIQFGTGNWKFNFPKFWQYVRPGIPRALGKIALLTVWSATARVMTVKGGDYLLILSIGGTVSLFFSFIGDGLYQGMVTIASNLIGAKNFPGIWKQLKSGFYFLFIIGAILSVPLIMFPDILVSIFFRDRPELQLLDELYSTFFWVWFHLICYMCVSILLSIITASKDTFFYFTVVFFTWLTSYVPVYVIMNILNWSPDKLWLVLGFEAIVFSCVYFIRVRKQKWINEIPKLDYWVVES